WSAHSGSGMSSCPKWRSSRFLCALIYPILKELRAERVTGEDGTEEKILGFWSLLVLSVLVGCICCPGMDFPTLRTVAHVRDVLHTVCCVKVRNPNL
uniref:Uncharacterized protein n=1 Tax=Maylandia zebra TaxID=106582 RepID=A0A3P9ASI3_9CICH